MKNVFLILFAMLASASIAGAQGGNLIDIIDPTGTNVDLIYQRGDDSFDGSPYLFGKFEPGSIRLTSDTVSSDYKVNLFLPTGELIIERKSGVRNIAPAGVIKSFQVKEGNNLRTFVPVPHKNSTTYGEAIEDAGGLMLLKVYTTSFKQGKEVNGYASQRSTKDKYVTSEELVVYKLDTKEVVTPAKDFSNIIAMLPATMQVKATGTIKDNRLKGTKEDDLREFFKLIINKN